MLGLYSAALSASRQCQVFGPRDAILLVDPQNCFMENRTVNGSVEAAYPLDGADVNPGATGQSNFSHYDAQRIGDTLTDGSLKVAGSSLIIPVLNDWVDAAAGGRTLATMDYHPEYHCSFCKTHEGGILPGSYCLSAFGSLPVPDSRCVDAISEESFFRSNPTAYYQWPSHCVAGTFGARFDPYLNLPNDTTVVKLGTGSGRDSYSGFSSAAVTSTAAAGEHDHQSTSTAATVNVTLGEHLQRGNITRLFVMGLATDFVVSATVNDALEGLGYGLSDEYVVVLVEPLL